MAASSVLYLCNHTPPIAPRFCVALIGTHTVAFEIAEWRQLIAAELPFAELVVMDAEDQKPPPVTFCDGAFAPSSYIRTLLQLGLPDAERRAPLQALLAALEATALALQAQVAEHERRLAPLLSSLYSGVSSMSRLMLHPDRHPPTTTTAIAASLWLDPTTTPRVLLVADHPQPPQPTNNKRDAKTMTDGVSFLQRQSSEMKSNARRRLLQQPQQPVAAAMYPTEPR